MTSRSISPLAAPLRARLLLLSAFALVVLAGCTPGGTGGPERGRAPEVAAADTLVADTLRIAADTLVVDTLVAADTLPDLELRFLDVGQGDGVLVRNGDRVALIDAGPANRIVDQLRALGIEQIDLMIATHNHADHIGGMDAILDALPVRFYLDNGHPATTQIQRRVLERVESKGVTYLEATPRSIALGDAQLRIIPPPEGVGGEEQNNRSVSVVLERGSFRALMTGDSETEMIQALLAGDAVPQVQVLKAAHHGSRNGVTPGLLARTRPELVAISVATNNSYGHPHESAMRYYCTGQRRVLRTDQVGDIVITVRPSGEYGVGAGRSREGSAEVRALPEGIEAATCAAYSARPRGAAEPAASGAP